MSADTAALAFLERIRTGWTETPVDWPNGPLFTPPADEAWIRPVPTAADGQPTAWGARRSVYGGTGVVELFYPLARGAGPAWAMAGRIAALYEGQRSGTVEFSGPGAGGPRIDGLGEVGGWYRLNVVVSMTWENT